MDYDFRNRNPYGPPPAGTTSSLYPRLGPHHGPPPPSGRPPYQSNPPPPSSGVGIRVSMKPEYQITPPPAMASQVTEVPRSTFSFNFDFEKKLLAEAERDMFSNWGRIAAENQPSKTASPSSSTVPSGDPAVDKYVASGLGREPVSFAVLNYGDDPVKVRKFVKGYNVLREMGFTSRNVPEVLAMYDNDTDKALAHLLNNPS